MRISEGLDNENELLMPKRSNTTTRRQPLREGTRPAPATTTTPPRPVPPRRRRQRAVTFHDDVTIHTVECWRHTLDTIEKRTVWYTGNELRRMMVLYRNSNKNNQAAIVGGRANQYQPHHHVRKKRKRSVTITEEYVDPQKRDCCAAVVDRTTKNTTTKKRIQVRTMRMKTPSNVTTHESRRNHNFLLALNQSFSIQT